jgi:hypothetical protein
MSKSRSIILFIQPYFVDKLAKSPYSRHFREACPPLEGLSPKVAIGARESRRP